MPIIQSLLDTDFYKLTMGQLVFRKYRDVKVKYEFINRTKDVALGNIIPQAELREQLDAVQNLGINKTEYRYLKGIALHRDSLFTDDYLQWLQALRMPDYELAYEGGDIKLSFSGPWAKTIYWETIALAIINELYYYNINKELTSFGVRALESEGVRRLAEKIEILKANPDITFIDFGTRRRFCRSWQKGVVGALKDELSARQFKGTSNVLLAKDLDLDPVGTSAHEMFMVMAGIGDAYGTPYGAKMADDNIRESHNGVLSDWWGEYGTYLSIALTDTFGSEFFFRDMTKDQAYKWKGLRQDSGSPIRFIDKAVDFYNGHGIDPLEKVIVFSDGLDIEAMKAIARKCRNRIGYTFGWGTNLTNDLGPSPLSIVVKVTEANGRPTVKLSDNLAKATGQPLDVARYKRIFGYSETFAQATTY